MNSYAMPPPTKNNTPFASEGATTIPSTIATATIARALPKPKRPLSAFNLFYRYKRQHIIKTLASNVVGSVDKDTLRQLIEAPPGLEDCYKYTMVDASPEQVIQLRRQNIREELKDHMNARDAKARAHRKDKSMAGSLSFVELGKLMNKSWKESCDDVAKEIFNALAEVGRNKYRQQVKEYHDMNKLLGLGKVSKVSKKKKRKQDEEDETTKITKLSNQMDIATEKSNGTINTSSSPPLQRDLSTDSSKLSDEDDNMVVASLLQLSNQRTATPPVKRRKMNGPIKKRVLNTVEKPNLLDLLSSNNSVEDGRSTVDLPRRSVMSMQQTMADLSLRQNQQGGGYTYPRPPTRFDTLPNESELISRVMDMERQLTRERNERVRSRMLVLQDQISRGLFDSAITEQARDNILAFNAPVPPPNHTLPMGNNQESLLTSLVSASMARQSAQQEQEQRAMLLHKILSQRSQPPPCTAPLVHKDTVPRAA